MVEGMVALSVTVVDGRNVVDDVAKNSVVAGDVVKCVFDITVDDSSVVVNLLVITAVDVHVVDASVEDISVVPPTVVNNVVKAVLGSEVCIVVKGFSLDCIVVCKVVLKAVVDSLNVVMPAVVVSESVVFRAVVVCCTVVGSSVVV